MGTQTQLPFDDVFLPSPQRIAPRVWLEEVAIHADADTVLRRVELRPGLNVVWAPDASPEEQVGARIGHGAGKTLLCRMIRHALGEPDLASPDDEAALRRVFPDGVVRAVVHVDGVRYDVERPFDPKRGSEAKRSGEPTEYAAFVEALRATLDASATTLIGALDPWLAALAWISRDQERRLGGPLAWRHRVAAPSSKIARVANLERIRVVRSLVQLRTSDDVAAETLVANLEASEASMVRELTECDREIEWLSKRLAKDGHGPAVDLAQPLRLRALLNELSETLEALERPTSEPEALVASRNDLQAARIEEAVVASRVERARALLERRRAHAEGHEAAGCDLCHAPLAADAKLAKASEREMKALEKQLEKARKRVTSAQRAVDKATLEFEHKRQRDREAWARTREERARAIDLTRLLERKDDLSRDLATIARELDDARLRRDDAARDHARRSGHVASVFDFVVRRLAGQQVRGKFVVSATSLDASLRLPDGRRGTSPAMRVLETLALDLTALILACEGHADLPGFWIHDSPREADLARSHYEALFRLAAWLEEQTETPGFQYILTTTTSPPKWTADRVLQLGAARAEDLLLGRALT